MQSLYKVARAYLSSNDKFEEEYEVSPEIERKLNESNTAKEIRQYIQHVGVRIEAVQSVADKNIAYIVFKTYGSEAVHLSSISCIVDFEWEYQTEKTNE